MGKLVVRKRTGTTEEFSSEKLAASLAKALAAVQVKKSAYVAETIAERIGLVLARHFIGVLPRTQDVHDVAIEQLNKAGQRKAAVAFERHRAERDTQRTFKSVLGVRDDLGLPPRAIAVLAGHCLARNAENTIIETPGQLFRRVARAVAQTSAHYGAGATAVKKLEDEYYAMLSSRNFLPNKNILANAGGNNRCLASIILPVEDDLRAIFGTLADMASLLQNNAVVALPLGKLRCRGSLVARNRRSSGAVSFLRLFDQAAETIHHGKKNAGVVVLPANHPDIEEFIAMGKLRSFCRVVAVPDALLKAAAEEAEWPLVDPGTGKETRRIKAADILSLITEEMHRNGDPVLVFGDGKEFVGGAPFESSPQGVINLAMMVERNHIAWERLRKTVHAAVRFLDDVIDLTVYPLPAVEAATKAKRKIGVGVMGFADMLVGLGVVYGGKKSLDVADQVMKFINDEARRASMALASRGAVAGDAKKPLRNAALLGIIPTGPLAVLGPATPGIEPLQALVAACDVGGPVLHVNPVFEKMARDGGFYAVPLLFKVARAGMANVTEVPREMRALFVTASDVPLEAQLKMQAVFEKHCKNVAKAIALPPAAKPMDIGKLVLAAHRMGLKSLWCCKQEPVGLHPADCAGPCAGGI